MTEWAAALPGSRLGMAPGRRTRRLDVRGLTRFETGDVDYGPEEQAR